MKVTRSLLTLAAVATLMCAIAAPASAQTTATVTGTVKDTQGGIVPGATVSLISETRGTILDTQTAATGDFVFSNVTGDTYTVRVTMDGFKTSERKGNADCTFDIRSDQAQLDDLLRDTGTGGTSSEAISSDLPDFSRSGMLSRVIGAVANDGSSQGCSPGRPGRATTRRTHVMPTART